MRGRAGLEQPPVAAQHDGTITPAGRARRMRLGQRRAGSRHDRRPRAPLMAAGLAGLAVVLPIATGDAYILQVASLAALGAMLAISLGLLYGHAGQLSFAHAAFYGIGAYTSVILHVQLGAPFLLSLLAACALAGGVALVVGLPTLRLRGNYLAVATMALQLGISQYFINAPVTGGTVGIFGIQRPVIAGLSFESPGAYYGLLAIVAIGVYGVAHLVVHSRAGRALAAIREDETAARVIGVAVAPYKVGVFALTAMMAGLAGGLFAYQLGYISPESFDLDWSIAVLSMVIIGGKRTPAGALLGAVVVTLLTQLLFSLGDFQFLIYGAWIILVMLFMPDGLVGLVELVQRRVGPRRAGPGVVRAAAASDYPTELGGRRSAHGG